MGVKFFQKISNIDYSGSFGLIVLLTGHFCCALGIVLQNSSFLVSELNFSPLSGSISKFS